jgi:hypothetical protein
MNCSTRALTLPGTLLLVASILATPVSQPAAPQKKEYLSDAEADKIRDTDTTGARIALYAAFAADRIKKLQYEFAHLDPADSKRTSRLNNLINSYSGCIDDAADLLDVGLETREDIRGGAKTLQSRIKEFLPYLQELAAKGPEREAYKDNLDDAIEATQDAAKDVERTLKEMASPVRRRPS